MVTDWATWRAERTAKPQDPAKLAGMTTAWVTKKLAGPAALTNLTSETWPSDWAGGAV
jgi:hypothetical protein